ncbi:MAG TPA: leucine-rich repeat-containing protein kinase family protein [Rhodocyclaceae bacterium]|nr:leucine-rich repeat-containing protein kinase family protein [Rhodocyclaceae bacterium]
MHTLEDLRSGRLSGLRRLDLACGLTEFPREIFYLADSLEILNLSGNRLSSLPDDLPRLHRLRIVFCSDNDFTELPEVLGRCPRLEMVGFKANRIRTVSDKALPAKLRWLILTDNQVDELPSEIGNCRQLQKLMLAGNRLRSLPSRLAECTNLELLRISANRLESLPDWLFSLPRLAWLAYGGNPLGAEREASVLAEMPVTPVGWDELEIRRRLGEGASGVIHEAAHGAGPVALKVFKGAVTSDGLPGSEMAAWIQAGRHPNLIPVTGRLHGHPDGADGLLMPLVDPEFGVLAGPPSLESCTRDVYGPEKRFSLGAALRIAQGIASAVRHLHGRGIVHGDLYAHNILHCGEGSALLGDFGAASFLMPEDGASAAAIQRLEARAFGCLLEELVERCDAPASSGKVVDALVGLRDACLGEEVGARPLFEDIEGTLRSLAA